MLRRLVLIPMILLLDSTASIAGAAQPATPATDQVIQDHLEWYLGLFDGGAESLTEAEVEERFDQGFLELVPASELIATTQRIAGELGPLHQVDDQTRNPDEFIGVFEAESGDHVMIAFAVDPETGLITGFFITPADVPAAEGSPVATPAPAGDAPPPASPVAATPVVVDPDEQIALHADIVSEIRAVSDPVLEAVVAGDQDTLLELVSPEVAGVFQDATIADIIDGYTTSQVQMVLPEEHAYFFGQWSDSGIQGFVIFGEGDSAIPFELQAEIPQDGGLPSGRFNGALQQDQSELSVDFSANDDGNLGATLNFPALGIEGAKLSEVAFLEERPIGEMVDDSVIAHGDANMVHRADFAWGDHLIRVSVGVDPDTQQANAVQVLPAIPTPPAAPDAPQARATYHLPFEGLWWVYWGGDTQLRNYHAEFPSQRYACDLVVWKDGTTFRGDGTSNEDYWAWGQPVYAPASGTVVNVENGLPDIEPNLPPGERNPSHNPAGNHVVIETAEDEYVFVAHMQQGSVQVAVGDQVSAGDPIGLTGNSGNTSEPHIHIHVQDTPDVYDLEANGIPLVFASAVVDGEPQTDAAPVQGNFVSPE